MCGVVLAPKSLPTLPLWSTRIGYGSLFLSWYALFLASSQDLVLLTANHTTPLGLYVPASFSIVWALKWRIQTGHSEFIHSSTTILPAQSARATFLPSWSLSVKLYLLLAGLGALPYLTPQPYALVLGVLTVLPASSSSRALATWFVASAPFLPRGSSSMAPP